MQKAEELRFDGSGADRLLSQGRKTPCYWKYRVFLTHGVKPNGGGRIWQYRQAGVGEVVCGHYHAAYQKRWGGNLFSASGVSGAGTGLGTRNRI